jgi:hypothetical protein
MCKVCFHHDSPDWIFHAADSSATAQDTSA